MSVIARAEEERRGVTAYGEAFTVSTTADPTYDCYTPEFEMGVVYVPTATNITLDFGDGSWTQGYYGYYQYGDTYQHTYNQPGTYALEHAATCGCYGSYFVQVQQRTVRVWPKVTLTFRASGSQSADNSNTSLSQLGASSLGVLNSPIFMNAEETQGAISPAGFQGATYDIKRIFKAAGEVIENGTVVVSISAGSSDDNTNSDEDLTPQNNHIYGIDAPNLGIGPNSPGIEGNTLVQRAKFTETVECTIQGVTKVCSNALDWCFVTSLKRQGGVWIRNPAGVNVIQAGSSCY